MAQKNLFDILLLKQYIIANVMKLRFFSGSDTLVAMFQKHHKQASLNHAEIQCTAHIKAIIPVKAWFTGIYNGGAVRHDTEWMPKKPLAVIHSL